MRICLTYDCLYPCTIGGAERWYRALAEHLARQGHEVTYLTMRQWERGSPPVVPGVKVIAVAPRMRLYGSSGGRRILPPLVMGAGVLLHVARARRRYDLVHTASFPFFPLLALALLRMPMVVDWHEHWSRQYWRRYLGPVGGAVGWWVQRLCTRIPHQSVTFSEHTHRQLGRAGLDPILLSGLWDGLSPRPPQPPAQPPVLLFAGRWVREKRLMETVAAARLAARDVPGLQLHLYGDGPERGNLEHLAAAAPEVVQLVGRVSAAHLEAALATAAATVLFSEREGYGLLAVESMALGVPVVTAPGPDTAVPERIVDGVNGRTAVSTATADLAAAIVGVVTDGQELRARTAAWFADHADELSLPASLRRLEHVYARARR